MSLYYFHIRDADRLIIDDFGLELPTLKEAVAEAFRGVASMLAEARRSGDDLSGQVMEITNESGQVLATVPFKQSNSLGS